MMFDALISLVPYKSITVCRSNDINLHLFR